MLTIIASLPPDLIDAIGVAGFALYVLTYGLLTFRKIGSETITYFALNWVAATCVLIGLTGAFNLASALIQVFWIAISTIAIIIRLRRKETAQDTLKSLDQNLAA